MIEQEPFLSVWSRRIVTTRLVQLPSVCMSVCVCEFCGEGGRGVLNMVKFSQDHFQAISSIFDFQGGLTQHAEIHPGSFLRPF